MIVDTSALIAIIRGEPERAAFVEVLHASERPRLSAAGYLESGIVVDRGGDPADAGRLDELLHATGIEIEPVTAGQARVARRAYREFGKGSGHPAQLNFGDCFAYALAQDTGEALLYCTSSGGDFTHAGVLSALPAS